MILKKYFFVNSLILVLVPLVRGAKNSEEYKTDIARIGKTRRDKMGEQFYSSYDIKNNISAVF